MQPVNPPQRMDNKKNTITTHKQTTHQQIYNCYSTV